MICIYKDERITIFKNKGRNRDKQGNKSRYTAELHCNPFSKNIKFMIQSKDVPKLIADHSARFVAMQNEGQYSIYYNGINYCKMEDCEREKYKIFLDTYHLHEIFTIHNGSLIKHYLR